MSKALSVASLIVCTLVVTTTYAANDAEFVSQSVPVAMLPGSVHIVSVTFLNTGSTTWHDGINPYRLSSDNPVDNLYWNVNRVDLDTSETVLPSATKTFTFSITAPLITGTYSFRWVMLEDGVEYFGDASVGVNVLITSSLTADDCTDTNLGYDDELGLDGGTGDKRFLCSENQWYDCGWGYSVSWDINADHQQVVGSWVCIEDEAPHWQPTAEMSAFVSQDVPVGMVPGVEYPVSITLQNTGSTTWHTGTMPYALGSRSPIDNTVWGFNRVALDFEEVPPNGYKTFTFDVVAPLVEGNYAFRWHMLREGGYWFGAPTEQVNVLVSSALTSADCTERHLGFDDVVGLDGPTGDQRFYCSNGEWHDCGWGYSVDWCTNATDLQVVGSRVCMIEQTLWQDAANLASFVSQNVPQAMAPGGEYEVSLTFQNIGSTTWQAGVNPYGLGSRSPYDTMRWGTNRISFDPLETTAPSGQKTFNFTVTAPTGDGNYAFEWSLVQDGVHWFGQRSELLSVNVSSSISADDCVYTHLGTHGAVGIDDDDRYMCFENQWYDCGDPSSAPWHVHATDEQALGNRTCDLANARWLFNDCGDVDDGNVCTTDGCDPVLGPTHEPFPSCAGFPPDSSAPGAVPSIAIGMHHTCVSTHDGLQCFGSNEFGQLGDGTLVDSAAPVAVAFPVAVNTVVAGRAHSCALVGGSVYCWGANEFGQLGNNDYFDSTTPVHVSGIDNAVLLTAGDDHTCAADGVSLKCWGRNDRGQLGDDTFFNRRVATTIFGSSPAIRLLAAGAEHTCFMGTGGMRCFGAAGGNQATEDLAQQSATGVFHVLQIATGGRHTCALTPSALRCWGQNTFGQLGNNSTTSTGSGITAAVAGVSTGVRSITAGRNHTCLLSDGAVSCWGDNTRGQGGHTGSQSSAPVLVRSADDNVHSLFAGSDRTCLVRGGGIECFGSNDDDALGSAASGLPQSADTVPIEGIYVGVQTLASGESFSCAIVNGGVQCWGKNDYGQLGSGGATGETGPVAVSGLTLGVSALSVGKETACAIVNGAVKCWGRGTEGQIGNNASSNQGVPTQVQGLTSGAIAIAVGDNAACAIVHGALTCWGNNTYGQLCDSTTTSSTVPVASITWTSSLGTLVAGGEHFCANSLFQGTVCWGRNDEGQLGNGSTTDATTPGNFSSIPHAITQIVAGAKHTCVSLNGAPYCWGRNNEGQLGDGTLTDRLQPVAVDGLTNVRSLIVGRNQAPRQNQWMKTAES